MLSRKGRHGSDYKFNVEVLVKSMSWRSNVYIFRSGTVQTFGNLASKRQSIGSRTFQVDFRKNNFSEKSLERSLWKNFTEVKLFCEILSIELRVGQLVNWGCGVKLPNRTFLKVNL